MGFLKSSTENSAKAFLFCGSVQVSKLKKGEVMIERCKKSFTYAICLARNVGEALGSIKDRASRTRF